MSSDSDDEVPAAKVPKKLPTESVPRFDCKWNRYGLQNDQRDELITRDVAAHILKEFPDMTIAICQIRLVPLNLRKATIMLIGPAGTGKTYLSKLLTHGMNIGVVNGEGSTNFMLSDTLEKDAVIWEEAQVPFQFAQTYKCFMQGHGYSIDMKKKDFKIQTNWTPVIMTCNQIPWRTVGTGEDKRAFADRCITINVNKKWMPYDDDTMMKVDRQLLVDILEDEAIEEHYKYRTEVTRLYKSTGEIVEVGFGRNVTKLPIQSAARKRAHGEHAQVAKRRRGEGDIRSYARRGPQHDSGASKKVQVDVVEGEQGTTEMGHC